MTWYEPNASDEVKPFSFGGPASAECTPWSFETAAKRVSAADIAAPAAPVPVDAPAADLMAESGVSNASVQLRATGGHTTIGQAANLDVESLLGREDVAEVVESKARAIADDRWASVAASLADGAELAQSSQSVELIAAAVAQIVIGDALVDSVSRWASLVDGVAQSIERTEPATLKVHPDAVDTVREAMADRAAWRVEADASLAYGDVAVETEQGAVVGTMQERIARLVQAARAQLSQAVG